MAKKTNDTPNVPATLFQICDELQTIKRKLEDADGELQEGDFEALQRWEAALEVKAENVCFFLEKLKSSADYFDAIEKRAYARKQAVKGAFERMKKYLKDSMIAANVLKIKREDGLFSIRIQDGKTSTHIDDQNLLPLEYVQIVEVVNPDKAAIKKALDAGKTVPGAHIETGEPFIVIS